MTSERKNGVNGDWLALVTSSEVPQTTDTDKAEYTEWLLDRMAHCKPSSDVHHIG